MWLSDMRAFEVVIRHDGTEKTYRAKSGSTGQFPLECNALLTDLGEGNGGRVLEEISQDLLAGHRNGSAGCACCWSIAHENKKADEKPPLGATIIDRRRYSGHPGDDYLEIVLCKRDDEPRAPFVTWAHNMETGGFFWGHYCATLEEAAKDFLERGPQNH